MPCTIYQTKMSYSPMFPPPPNIIYNKPPDPIPTSSGIPYRGPAMFPPVPVISYNKPTEYITPTSVNKKHGVFPSVSNTIHKLNVKSSTYTSQDFLNDLQSLYISKSG